jgi:branched-chain amino acid transport system substrate-binding protein
VTGPARAKVSLAVSLAAALAGLAGCGGSSRSTTSDRIDGSTLTIYSSAPLHGASAAQGQAIVNGERLALSRLHGRIGRYRIALLSLDDATVKRGAWDPGQTTLNARRAAADPSAIGYLGEDDSGASAVSIPILNRAGIPQLSATSTAVGLTSGAPGASPGEPQKYYPTKIRTFARVIPNDSAQAVAQIRLQQSLGCTSTYVLDDGGVDGYDAAIAFQLTAPSFHLRVAGVQTFDPHATDYTALTRTMARTFPDCVLISAAVESNTVLLTEQVAVAMPRALLFGTAELAEPSYIDPKRGGIPRSLDERVSLTAATLGPRDYPPPGRAFLAAYRRRFGAPQPSAIFGYETMSLLLSAISRATEGGTARIDRAAVLRALFSTRERESVLGTYSIDRDGDTTLRVFGAYGVSDGRLRFLRTIQT